MKPILRYLGKTYSYIVVDGEVIVFRVSDKKDDLSPFRKIDKEFEAEIDQMIVDEMDRFEALLSEEELKDWRGKSRNLLL